MSGAIPPLPNTPAWRGAQLKHRDSSTFYLYLIPGEGDFITTVLFFECYVFDLLRSLVTNRALSPYVP